MVALEISTERRPSNHPPGNASVDPTFKPRECPGVWLPKQLAELEKIAKREDRAVSYIIRKAIDEYIKREKR